MVCLDGQGRHTDHGEYRKGCPAEEDDGGDNRIGGGGGEVSICDHPDCKCSKDLEIVDCGCQAGSKVRAISRLVFTYSIFP